MLQAVALLLSVNNDLLCSASNMLQPDAELLHSDDNGSPGCCAGEQALRRLTRSGRAQAGAIGIPAGGSACRTRIGTGDSLSI